MRFWLAAAPALYFLFFFQLTASGLVGPDEPRYAWVSRAMAQSGDWVTPRLWQQPWFEKPALLYWMTAAGFRAGLDEDWAPRLPVALLSAAFLVFFRWRMKAEFGSPAAEYATAVLATSAGWAAYSHAAVFDLPLSATFGAAMLMLLAWIERKDQRALAAFGALLGLSTLAKGLVGPALAVLALAVWAARAGFRRLLGLLRPAPCLAFLAVAAPWYALCYARNGSGFLAEFFVLHHMARFGGALEHNQPVWFFLPVLAGALLPWTPLVGWLGRDWREPRRFLLLGWAATTLVFFSLSRDKLPGYILPALVPLAALAGLALAEARVTRWALPLCAATLALMAPAASVLPTALDAGLGRAWPDLRVGLLPLTSAGALAAAVWLAERAGRRTIAVAAVAVAAVAGYALIKHTTLPEVGRRAGARALWRESLAHPDAVCLGELRRHHVYGLHYYAARRLPDCDDGEKPYRIENGRLVLSSKVEPSAP